MVKTPQEKMVAYPETHDQKKRSNKMYEAEEFSSRD